MMSENELVLGFEVEADAEVQYGEYRLAVAAWANVEPEHVSARDVEQYEIWKAQQ